MQSSAVGAVVTNARAFLPGYASSPNPKGKVVHGNLHTNAYHDAVFRRLTSAKTGADAERKLREIAWEHCGIVRSAGSLRSAVDALEAMEFNPAARAARSEFERRNIHAVALLIAKCALAREESRGAHYRTDHPETKPEYQRHSYITSGDDVRFE